MKKPRILIIGGAGFIGSNAVDHFLRKGYPVSIFDNLSRKGAQHNIAALKKQWPTLAFTKGDIVTERKKLNRAVAAAEVVIHLAAQVAVTSSVNDPYFDFHTNALGTLHVLEAARASGHNPLVIYSSTNKVYGGMEQVRVVKTPEGYRYKEMKSGISEAFPLDFHSPYGCSKGAADQYVHDYHRIYGLPTVVLRQSCIYGPRQFGVEDQGWLAWFTIAALLGKKITVYGDGYQSRDVLFVDDLCRLYERVIECLDIAAGKIYNVGGGPKHAHSVRGTLTHIGKAIEKEITFSRSAWRPGDQKVYVSDIRRAAQELGWRPQVGLKEGLAQLASWTLEHEKILRKLF